MEARGQQGNVERLRPAPRAGSPQGCAGPRERTAAQVPVATSKLWPWDSGWGSTGVRLTGNQAEDLGRGVRALTGS